MTLDVDGNCVLQNGRQIGGFEAVIVTLEREVERQTIDANFVMRIDDDDVDGMMELLDWLSYFD